jgi:hypothetical protein
LRIIFKMKGKTAMRASTFLPISAGLLLAFAAGSPAVAQDNAPSVQIETTSFALGLSGQSGDGLLTLPNLGTNCSYRFKVSGFGAGIHVGISKVSAGGPVKGLTRLEDFAGDYSVVQGESTVLVGGGGMSLKNKRNNVVMDLSSRTEGLGLGIGAQGLTIKMTVPPQNATRWYVLEFGFNKDWVGDEARGKLNQLVNTWKCRFGNFEVVGHSDTVGKEDQKLELSDKRAAAVRDYLLGAGIPASRVTAHGVGSNDLQVQTPQGVRLRDNRVVVVTVQ